MAIDREEEDAANWAAYHADQLAFQQQAEDALKASLIRPLNPDEVAALAWLAHIPNPTEIRK